MDTQNVVYTYKGICLASKNEWNAGTHYNIHEPWKHYAKWNKPVTKRQILYDSTYVS